MSHRLTILFLLTVLFAFEACKRAEHGAGASPAEAAYQAGLAKGRLKDWDGAINEFDRAIELDPKFALAYFERGNAYEEKGFPEEAGKWFTQALSVDATCWQAHSHLTKLSLEKNDREAAYAHAEAAVKLRPDLAETQNNIGAVLEQRGQLEDALSHLHEAHRLAPDITIYQVNLGNLQVRMGRNQDALGNFGELLKREPNNPTFLCNYGVALYFLHRDDEAIDFFRKALAINPKLKDANENLATALKRKGAAPVGTPGS